MELSIKDRLYLPTFLPAKGNFKDFNLKKEILRKIAISDDERKEINFRENQEDNRLEWDVEKETPLIAILRRISFLRLKSLKFPFAGRNVGR